MTTAFRPAAALPPSAASEVSGGDPLRPGGADVAIAALKETRAGRPSTAPEVDRRIDGARQARRALLREQALAYAEACRREGLWREAVRGWTDALELFDENDPARVGLQKRIRGALRRHRLRRALVWGFPVSALALILGVSAHRVVADRDGSRRREADAKLGAAAAAEREGDLDRAVAGYLAVAAGYPGTDAAGTARDRMERAKRFAESSARDLEAGARAIREEKFAAAREPLERVLRQTAFAATAPCREAERLMPWARHGDALRQARQALEAGRFAEAEDRFRRVLDDTAWPSVEIADRARDGLRTAAFGRWSEEGKRFLDAGRPAEARDALARANALAPEVGRAPVDLAPFDEAARRQEELDAAVARLDGLRRLCRRDFAGAAERLAEAARRRPEDRTAIALLAVARAGRFPEGMVLVPGGPAIVGSLDALDGQTPPDALDEMPPQAADLAPYFIDRTEVTRETYARFVAATRHAPPPSWNGTRPSPGRESYPVVDVSWDDATAFAAWAGKRLPTEEEWEAAARAAPIAEQPVTRETLMAADAARRELEAQLRALSSLQYGAELKAAAAKVPFPRRYPWGDAWDPRACPLGKDARLVGASPVGAGALGVVDMAGNVWEWTASAYLPYRASMAGPPFREDHRVIRGGSWRGTRYDVRCANRAAYNPGSRFDDVGFRCAAGPEEAVKLMGPSR